MILRTSPDERPAAEPKSLHLEIRDVVVRFNGIAALDGLSFTSDGAGVMGIVGPNGAGKTTLFHVITGFLRPNSGSIRFKDQELLGLGPDAIAQLGVARSFQELRLFRQMTVLDNLLAAPPSQRGENPFRAVTRAGFVPQETANRERAAQVLSFLGLAGEAPRLAGELSFGQQKLLTLGIALATRADLLLLDEPVAGVQPALRDRILRHLREIADGGRMVVFIEHDVDAIRQIADRAMIMDAGRTLAVGPAQEVLQREELLRSFLE